MRTYPPGIKLVDIAGTNRTFRVGDGFDELLTAAGEPVEGRDVFRPLGIRHRGQVLQLVPDMLDAFTIAALEGRSGCAARYGDRLPSEDAEQLLGR